MRLDDKLLKVAILFAAVAIVGFLGIYLAAAAGFVEPVCADLARQVGGLASAVGIPSTVDGINIYVGERMLVVALECTAVFLMIIYAALVLAYPFSRALKCTALLAGLVVIHLANLLRLVAVCYVAMHASPRVFSILHDVLFQLAMTLVVLALFLSTLAVDRRARSGVVGYFVSKWVVISVVIGVLSAWLTTVVSWFPPLAFIAFVIPACTLILLGSNFSMREKAEHIVPLLLFFTAVYAMELQFSVFDTMVDVEASLMLRVAVGVLYTSIMIAAPVLWVIHFVGRKPSRLWVAPVATQGQAHD